MLRVLVSTSRSAVRPCFVAYHPDKEHPYKHTRPTSDFTYKQEADEVLVKDYVMHTNSPNLEQLQALTYTPKSYWHQFVGRERSRKYKEYFNDNADRPGL